MKKLTDAETRNGREEETMEIARNVGWVILGMALGTVTIVLINFIVGFAIAKGI